MTALRDNLLALLRGHRLVGHVRVIYYDETPAGKVELKIRCRLAGKYQFQVWLHHEPGFQDYAYQLYTRQPLLRWDNAPHYPAIVTAPHHFHNENGQVSSSPLSGRPLEDVKKVLEIIEKWA
ncbi:hypothetical protein GW866_01450 [bacterium]|nr:hypothetical protein [bacterium]OIO89659.1 MAG: hypothetical protein AUK02_02165 [Anaerolineae bacterium CG2_30_58_95]PIZ25793.1 MAG: hypothetical protein COY47_04040 [Chloroflexi bacterium CG_4_10_14_0_8_um_filter_57_5]PJH76586.1 MAG: hypothetical protein CO064_00450 [Anaerolineae bacterium CG_4_9_14_0_8_um_filter_58_9]